MDTDEPPPPPTHQPEDEKSDDADNENEEGDEFQRKIKKKKKKTKLDKYEQLLKDPIFDPENNKPKVMPWGARDGEVRPMPGEVSAVALAPVEGAKFVPKQTAMDNSEKAKFERMKRMLAVVSDFNRFLPQKYKIAMKHVYLANLIFFRFLSRLY